MTNNLRVDRPVIHVQSAVDHQPEEKHAASISTNTDARPSLRVDLSSNSYAHPSSAEHGAHHQGYRGQTQRPVPSPIKFHTGAVLHQLMETMGGTGTQSQRSGTYLDTFV